MPPAVCNYLGEPWCEPSVGLSWPETMTRCLLLVLIACALSGCAAATIPLNAALGGAVTNNATARAEEIPAMNCRELRGRWQSLQNPLTMMNPTRLTSAERSLVRQTAARKGCSLS